MIEDAELVEVVELGGAEELEEAVELVEALEVVGTGGLERVVLLELMEVLDTVGLELTEILLLESVVGAGEPKVMLLELEDDVDTKLLEINGEVTVDWPDSTELVVEPVAELFGVTKELTAVLIEEGELKVDLLGMIDVLKVELLTVVENVGVSSILVDTEDEIERQEHALERRDAGY
ncbi:hypothetical protein MMC34_006013 [Xylographa carneopallida]|nr:hypothetical protein [Xylographa carneopallida]